jgi:energy-coupling factor transporter ATP-binding protein EcfA2
MSLAQKPWTASSEPVWEALTRLAHKLQLSSQFDCVPACAGCRLTLGGGGHTVPHLRSSRFDRAACSEVAGPQSGDRDEHAGGSHQAKIKNTTIFRVDGVAITRLKKIEVRKFRALQNVDIEFATHVTVICGKNGTSKSSILGIAAQVFSFEENYLTGQQLDFKTISGGQFTSIPREHFRFSDEFDVPGSLDVGVQLIDGYSGQDASADLELMKRTQEGGKVKPRPVVRNNSTAAVGNSSRNFTHPVIYLSLKRLQPITTRNYRVSDNKYLAENKAKFLSLSNKILNKVSSAATATAGTIASAVAHSSHYNQDSVSAGEDNVGQIVQALMSFRKLKSEYSDYKGGLLLIDEADAGLFPAAQLTLLDVLERECSELCLQVIMTSHSPTLIERVHELSGQYQRRFKTIYLSDTYGPVRILEGISWRQIHSDLLIQTVPISEEQRLPKVNVYFEDAEGFDLFKMVAMRQRYKPLLHMFGDVSMSCGHYLQMIERGVPEFSRNSVVVLDGDVGVKAAKAKSIALLPGKLPPDQLIFKFLYDLPPEDLIWVNSIGFTRPVFIRCAQEVISSLGLDAEGGDVEAAIIAHRAKDPAWKKNKDKARDLFKSFYKSPDFQKFSKIAGPGNPWKIWIGLNAQEVSAFHVRFVTCLRHALKVGYGIEVERLASFL